MELQGPKQMPARAANPLLNLEHRGGTGTEGWQPEPGEPTFAHSDLHRHLSTQPLLKSGAMAGWQWHRMMGSLLEPPGELTCCPVPGVLYA